MAGRDRWTAPFAWAGRVVRVPGEERRRLVQITKAAGAAVIAWVIATSVLRLPQPFLAPYAAVFLVQSTVYRSVRGWAEQVGAVAAGVLLAAAAGQFIPSLTVALGVVIFAGLLIGSWRLFGESGIWVGITGMLLVSYGNATEPVLLADRLLETALGAAIGALVNAVILPPLHGERLAAAAERLAAAIGDLLEETAELVRGGEQARDPDALFERVTDVRSLAGDAEDAIGWTRESRYLNLRRHRGGEKERSLAILVSLWPPLFQLIDAVRTATVRREPFRHPGRQARETVADLFDALAEAVRESAGGSPELDRCRELIAEIDRMLLEPADEVMTSLGLGAMALPARRFLDCLEGTD